MTLNLYDYVHWHAKKRKDLSSSVLRFKGASGMGDRFQGILFALGVSMITNRVLEIDDSKLLSGFFEPYKINYNGLSPKKSVDHKMFLFSQHGVQKVVLPDTAHKIVELQTNYDFGSLTDKLIFNISISTFKKKAFRLLFRPSNLLYQKIHYWKNTLFPNNENYMGLHIRMGDGAPNSFISSSKSTDNRITHNAAKLKVKSICSTYKNVLLVSDNEHLLKISNCAKIVPGNRSTMHINMKVWNKELAYTEIGLLALAQVFESSTHSRFSDLVPLMRNVLQNSSKPQKILERSRQF